MKNFKKVFFYLLLAIGVLLIASVGSVFLFKDKIIQQFIREANKQLATPVKIGNIDVSLFEDFPHLSIVFKDVYIEDSHPEQYPLFTAASLSFRLNPVEAYKGTYTITGLKIQDSETNLKINSKGENNYTVSKESSGGAGVSFDLQNVKLQNTRVRYASIPDNQEYIFDSEGLRASINTRNDIYTIGAAGDILIEKLKVNSNSFLHGKKFVVDADLVYDDINKELTIKPSDLKLKSSHFDVEGNYNWKEKSNIELSVVGKNANIQSLLTLLPESSSSSLEKYKSKGEVYFNAKLKGEISEGKSPSLSVDFGFNDATLFHPGYKAEITNAKMTGTFYSQQVLDGRHATLALKNVEGKLNGELFRANLSIVNFKDSDVLLDFKGKLDAASVASFYPIENLKNVSGTLLTDIAFDGRLSWLKTKATAQRASTRGSIELQNINFLYGKEETPVKNLMGTLQFNNNDLALSNVSAILGNSDFLLNGFFKNIITFLLFENQPIGIETDLKSNFLDLDQLFALGFGKTSPNNTKDTPEYEFGISRNVFLNFNCNVNAMRYKRFYATRMKGDLLVKNQMAVSRGIALQTMGGGLNLSGIVDAKNPKAIDVVSSFNLKGIHLDSVFYVFENFKQDFIMDKHLKGSTDATVTLEMVLHPSLRLFQETLIADISASIKNGQLNNFEPMQKLNKYLDDDGLSKIRFSELKNDIHIENKTIYIPQMEIRTNVTSLKLSGTHTFDQRIDYHIVAPLRNRKKIKEADAEGAFEEDPTGAKIYLKITGTTDNYRISYDTDAVKKKIVTELKNEVQELKDAFKNKGAKKKKELELEEDEYFEWGVEPDSTKRKN